MGLIEASSGLVEIASSSLQGRTPDGVAVESSRGPAQSNAGIVPYVIQHVAKKTAVLVDPLPDGLVQIFQVIRHARMYTGRTQSASTVRSAKNFVPPNAFRTMPG